MRDSIQTSTPKGCTPPASRLFSYKRGLSARLLLAIGGCSLLLFLMACVFHLYTEYQQDIDGINARFGFVEQSYVPALAASAYQLDEEQMHLQLRGILQLQDIVYVQVREQLGQETLLVSEGNPEVTAPIYREFHLLYRGREAVGILQVGASLTGVYGRLLSRAKAVALANVLVIGPLVLLILLIVRLMVHRHLEYLAKYAGNLQLDTLDLPLVLPRRQRPPAEQDELDLLVAAMNEMRLRLGEGIRQRQEAERELTFRNALLECVLETRLDGFCMVAENQICLFGNRCFGQMLGVAPEALVGASMASLWARMARHVRDPKHLEQALDHVQRKPETMLQGELSLTSGTILEYYSLPVQTGPQTRIGRLWSFRDVSKRKELEEQLRQRRKMETLGTLAGGIAHDFNNVLSPIIGYTELLAHQLRPDNPLQRDVGNILKAARQGTALTRQILAFSRKQQLEFQVIDLNAVVRDYQGLLQRLIGETITVRILPAEEPLPVYADTCQVEQVLLNMAVNARDAMPEGGILTIVTERVLLDGQPAAGNSETLVGPWVLLSISDTGVGIDETIRERIFDPFFTTKPPGQGTGLGLSTSFGIIKQHGGHVRVESQPNQGTTFRMYLPLASAASRGEVPSQMGD